MSEFSGIEYKTYEQEMWQEPKTSKQALWHEPANRYGTIPEPLYRLRISVLKNEQASDDCPLRMFVRLLLESTRNISRLK